jgi:photosystem II stability/assembly factor-like uncharacterized protein
MRTSTVEGRRPSKGRAAMKPSNDSGQSHPTGTRVLGAWRAVALVCAVFLVVGARGTYAGVDVWTTHWPYGGDVTSLVVDPHTPSTLYAGLAGSGVFKSTNGGNTWDPAGLANTDVQALAIDPATPSTVYAGGYQVGVFRSTDSGASWTSTGLADTNVVALVIDPHSPSTLYVGADGGGVFQSTNGGGSWTAGNTGLADLQVTALAIDPTTPSTLYAGTDGGGVFQSANGGTSWTEVNNGLTNLYVTAVAIDPATPSTLYAATSSCTWVECSGGVFRSTDSGVSWRVTGWNDPSRALAIDPDTPSMLYTVAADGVFRSINSGDTWTAVNTGLPVDAHVTVLVIDRTTPRTLFAGTNAGVFDIELACVVGSGTPDSCTEAALDACLPWGADFNGTVTFNCGPDPATITVTSRKTISTDTTIDGGGLITISGGGTVGVFAVHDSGVKFTVQNLTIARGVAP